MPGILEGVKVIDMGVAIAMPAAAVTLADWGAEVIRLEAPTAEMPRAPRRPGVADYSVPDMLHRNKKGMAVDLKKERGQEILHKLVQTADIFMGSYEHSALKQLKADYDTLSQINPGLIYCLLTGYGTKGPDKDQRGYDYAASWARGGMQYQIGEPGIIPPMNLWGFMDRVSASHCVGGILAALVHKERTGKGQQLETSLYHVGVWTLSHDIQSALVGMPLPQHDRTKARNPIFNSYRTKDDRWFFLAMLQSDLQWLDFCRAIEKPELENDPRFNNLETREQNCEELIHILDEVFATKTMEEWEKRFRENNCIYGKVETPAEVVANPQVLANDIFAEVPHPFAGQLKLITTPVKFCQNPSSLRSPAPEVGQHTEEILLDLGYTWEDIAQLKEQGVIL